MEDRQFVWTWWAGLVRDSFGPGSVFHVARFGSLRIRSGAARRRRGNARRVADGGVRRSAWGSLLVPITKLPSLVGGLLIRLNRSVRSRGGD